MLKKLGVASQIANSKRHIEKAQKLILPGVGHFDHGAGYLKEADMADLIIQKVRHEKVPILGICLGAQLLGNGSEEGVEPGLGLVDMDVVKFDMSKMADQLKVPHMGWSDVMIEKSDSQLFVDDQSTPRFYFVHSYHFKMHDKNNILCKSSYGYWFASGFQKENIYGVQFHPEKSHRYGMRLLENFSKID